MNRDVSASCDLRVNEYMPRGPAASGEKGVITPEGVLHVKHAPVFEKLLAPSRYKAGGAGGWWRSLSDRSNPKPDRGHHDLPQAQLAAAGLRG